MRKGQEHRVARQERMPRARKIEFAPSSDGMLDDGKGAALRTFPRVCFVLAPFVTCAGRHAMELERAAQLPQRPHHRSMRNQLAEHKITPGRMTFLYSPAGGRDRDF